MRNRIIPYRKDLKMRARRLRKESTSSEVFLWLEIKNRALGVQFHRQVPMLDYIVDSCLSGRQVYCHEIMLAVEVDGASHYHRDAIAYDKRRQKRLELEGVTFLRFDDSDVKCEMKWVVNEILDTVNRLRNGE